MNKIELLQEITDVYDFLAMIRAEKNPAPEHEVIFMKNDADASDEMDVYMESISIPQKVNIRLKDLKSILSELDDNTILTVDIDFLGGDGHG